MGVVFDCPRQLCVHQDMCAKARDLLGPLAAQPLWSHKDLDKYIGHLARYARLMPCLARSCGARWRYRRCSRHAADAAPLTSAS